MDFSADRYAFEPTDADDISAEVVSQAKVTATSEAVKALKERPQKALKALKEARALAERHIVEVKKLDGVLFAALDAQEDSGSDNDDQIIVDEYRSNRYIIKGDLITADDEKLLDDLRRVAQKYEMLPEEFLLAAVGQSSTYKIKVTELSEPKVLINIWPDPELEEALRRLIPEGLTNELLSKFLEDELEKEGFPIKPQRSRYSQYSRDERNNYGILLSQAAVDRLDKFAAEARKMIKGVSRPSIIIQILEERSRTGAVPQIDNVP